MRVYVSAHACSFLGCHVQGCHLRFQVKIDFLVLKVVNCEIITGRSKDEIFMPFLKKTAMRWWSMPQRPSRQIKCLDLIFMSEMAAGRESALPQCTNIHSEVLDKTSSRTASSYYIWWKLMQNGSRTAKLSLLNAPAHGSCTAADLRVKAVLRRLHITEHSRQIFWNLRSWPQNLPRESQSSDGIEKTSNRTTVCEILRWLRWQAFACAT